MQRGLLLAQRRKQIVLIQLANHLAFVDDIAHVHRQFLDDAAGLALDLHLRDRLNLSGRDHGTRQIDAFHLRQLLGIDLGRFRIDRMDGEYGAAEHDQNVSRNQGQCLRFFAAMDVQWFIRTNTRKFARQVPRKDPSRVLGSGERFIDRGPDLFRFRLPLKTLHDIAVPVENHCNRQLPEALPVPSPTVYFIGNC